MRQVIQSARTGKLSLKDVPEPKARPGTLLVRTRASLISAGTERMVVAFAKKSLAGKARARPDLVRKVLDKARRDGLGATFRAVMARLDEPLPLGYSAAGEVVAVGEGLEGRFAVGDRVACAGAGVANHAEMNVVPGNLAARVPPGVTDDEAAFATVAAIAMHAVRNLKPGLGDVIAVIGAGLVGQIAVRLLVLSGARVVALDPNPARLDLARTGGAEAAVNLGERGAENAIRTLTGGRGADGVLIAAATDGNEPFETAAAIARDRATVCLVGKTGTGFPFAEFMKKELNIVVSRSYGPGRYDADYEERGATYPEGWVRWTETANLAECVRLMAPDRDRRLDVGGLITHRFPLDDAEKVYAMMLDGSEPHLGVVLTYPETDDRPAPRPAFAAPKGTATGGCVLGLIGAGGFARSVLLPELKRLPGVTLHTVAARRGAGAAHAGETYGFLNAVADEDTVLDDPAINAVLIATRHDSHAELTARALERGKAVLVEKPLAIDRAGLQRVVDARNASDAFFQVGFNRRFAPMTAVLRDALAAAGGPRTLVLRINAGTLPGDHWTQDAAEGGGRIVGEACHFVDLARCLVGAPITSVQAAGGGGDGPLEDVAVTLRFADGSVATIVYTARGDAAYAKERIEAYAAGAVHVIEDFRTLETVSGGRRNTETRTQDKGFAAQLAAFATAVADGGPPPVDEAELVETSAATLAILDSLRAGQRIDL